MKTDYLDTALFMLNTTSVRMTDEIKANLSLARQANYLDTALAEQNTTSVWMTRAGPHPNKGKTGLRMQLLFG